MKVFSLYHNDTFVVAFPNKEDTIAYGKKHYGDYSGWDCTIVEEYLSKSPILYGSPYTTLTPQQTIPCTPGMTLTDTMPQKNPGTYPHIYCEGTK